MKEDSQDEKFKCWFLRTLDKAEYFYYLVGKLPGEDGQTDSRFLDLMKPEVWKKVDDYWVGDSQDPGWGQVYPQLVGQARVREYLLDRFFRPIRVILFERGKVLGFNLG